MKDGWHLGPGAGTILGIEVLLPNSMGRIWLEGAEGLHLLYGRNGSGKSTVVDALRGFFKGQGTSAKVRCFMRLPDSILEGPTRLADVEQDAADLLRTIIESDQFSLLADEPTYVAETLLRMQQTIDEGGETLEEGEIFPGDREYRYLEEHSLTDETRIGLQKVIAHEECKSDWLHSFALPWARDCLITCRERDHTGDLLRDCLQAVGMERSDEWIHEFGLADLDLWYQKLLGYGWEEFALLTLTLNIPHDGGVLELPYVDDLFGNQGDGGLPLPVAAMQEVAASRMICLENIGYDDVYPPNQPDWRGWEVSLAAKLSDETPSLTKLWSDTKDALRSALLRINPHASESTRELAATYRLIARHSDWNTFVEGVIPSILLAERTQLDFLFAEDGPPDHPYVCAEAGFTGLVIDGPLLGWPVVVELDDPIDADSWLTAGFSALFGSESEPPAIRDEFLTEVVGHVVGDDFGDEIRTKFEQSMRPGGSKPGSKSDSTELLWSGPDATALEVIAEFPQFDAFRDRVSAFGDLLPRLQIGLGGLRAEPTWWLPDWIDGKPVRLEALDQPTDTWVGIGDLSDAQRRWVAIAIQIGEARKEAARPRYAREQRPGIHTNWGKELRQTTLAGGYAGSIALFGDEIDAGVHVAASKAIFRTLAEIPGIGFVSSHSPTALRTPLVRLVNVHRNDSGKIAVTSPGLADDVEKTARRLGIDLTDVLASMYLAVIVEGSHDRIVIEELIRGEEYTDRMFVIEGRGTRSMTAVADSRLLVDFCDLRLLIVLDNVGNDRFKPVLDSLKNLCNQGVAVRNAIKESGLEQLRSESTPEERTLIEILERGACRRVLDRIDIHGLPARDIAELLPPNSFGLEHDWSHYGNEFRSTGRGRDFKTWLREEYHVSISQKTLKKAVTGLDQMTDALIALQEAVLVAAEMASRDRGLSVTE